MAIRSSLTMVCFLLIFCLSCSSNTVLVPETLRLTSIDDYQYLLQVNVGSYSNINTDDVYVIGWNGDWETLILMTPTDSLGWAEVTLTAESEGVYSFAITNSMMTEWFWLDEVDHPLIILTSWIDSNAGSDDKIFAFWVDGSDSYQYLEESL